LAVEQFKLLMPAEAVWSYIARFPKVLLPKLLCCQPVMSMKGFQPLVTLRDPSIVLQLCMTVTIYLRFWFSLLNL